MKVIIKNFMGCTSGEIVADKIALILGLNGQGKTSSLLPVAAALRGGVPLGLQKTKAGMLVKTGSGTAIVSLEACNSKVSVTWPKCERRTEGSSCPEASDIAVGTVKFPFLPDKEKIELLRSILKCEPTKEDLFSVIQNEGLGDKIGEIVWHSIEVEGWDSSLDRAKEKGRSLKSQWTIITGEAYGEKKGANWFPVGWENDLEGLSAETLETEITTARAELEFKIANQAVSEDELTRLKDMADRLEDCRVAYNSAVDAFNNKQRALKKAEDSRKKLPELPCYDLVCPHCGEPVVYENGKLVGIKQIISDEERTEMEQKILDADNAVSKAMREFVTAKSGVVLAEQKVKAAEHASAEYQAKKDKSVPETEVDAAREAVRKAEARFNAFNKYHEALRVHKSILENQKIIDVLDPEGIRRTTLQKGLDNFNSDLSAFCRMAGWQNVTVDGDMSVNYAGRPLVLCSESEKFRTFVTLQCLIADYDGSAAVVIDAADILDTKSRSGLFKLLAKQNYCSFVGMTVSRPDKVPDFKKLGIGRKYWIENGVCEEIYNG
jgi:hypothetical protein